MGRPKEFDLEVVLTAARDCFWADGISRTSISSLVDAMKIQRSSFYNSFSSREGILTTVLERYVAASPLTALMNARNDASGAKADLLLVDFILDFSHFLAEDGQGRGCLFFNGLSEVTPENEIAYELYHDYYARLTDGLSYLILKLEEEYPATDDESSISMDQILCILIGLAHFSKLDANELRLAKIGLDQLSGLSHHFAELIKNQSRSIETIRQSEEEMRLRA